MSLIHSRSGVFWTWVVTNVFTYSPFHSECLHFVGGVEYRETTPCSPRLKCTDCVECEVGHTYCSFSRVVRIGVEGVNPSLYKRRTLQYSLLSLL